jgi:hypothetical protein
MQRISGTFLGIFVLCFLVAAFGSAVAVSVLPRDLFMVVIAVSGVALKAFKNSGDFLSICETIPKDTPVYIDSDLGDGIKGEEIAKTIHEKGFSTICLETGHPPASFPKMPWIKEIISKEPPWTVE